jgi:hypothetical protein
MRPHLTVKVIKLRWFFDIVSETWWPSGHEFESHYFLLVMWAHLRGCVRE